jgi:uncharacterized protein YydD (DUF2326 family)
MRIALSVDLGEENMPVVSAHFDMDGEVTADAKENHSHQLKELMGDVLKTKIEKMKLDLEKIKLDLEKTKIEKVVELAEKAKEGQSLFLAKSYEAQIVQSNTNMAYVSTQDNFLDKAYDEIGEIGAVQHLFLEKNVELNTTHAHSQAVQHETQTTFLNVISASVEAVGLSEKTDATGDEPTDPEDDELVEEDEPAPKETPPWGDPLAVYSVK